MTEPREVESKFEASPEALDELLALDDFGDFTLESFPPKEQDDLYYDTLDAHLGAVGSSLRVRRKGTTAVLTFKGARESIGDQGNTVSRLEDEVDVPMAALEAMSGDAALKLSPEPSPLERARAISGRHDLFPVARLLTNRTVMLARSNAGVEVELAVDRCVAERLRDGRKVEFVEVEAELKRGDVAGLHEATRQLLEAVPDLRPSIKTKLKRALD